MASHASDIRQMLIKLASQTYNMKLIFAVAGILFLAVISAIFIIPSEAATQCSSYTSEAGCESTDCTWCDRCSGKDINNYGADRCVDNNLQCTYSCSKICGADCTADNDCNANLTDTTCFYAGLCGGCSCTYQSASCPQNGTLTGTDNQVCYYGARYCTSSGCSISSCALRVGQICDPVDGCIQCEDCTGDEFIINKKCAGNDILGSQITYSCGGTNGGQCNVTRTEVLVEKCRNGCQDAKCNDELCNIDGVNTNCNQYDGYYGETYCKGNDVYKGYHDYSCESNECTYINIETKLQPCNECQNGRCYDPGAAVIVNVTESPDEDQPLPILPNITQLPNTIAGGRVYNGVLFGSNDIRINANGRSGEVRFKVIRSNGLGTLTIEQERHAVFRTRNTGNFTVSFSGSLRMYTTGSGWLFFVPAVYDIGTIAVSYD